MLRAIILGFGILCCIGGVLGVDDLIVEVDAPELPIFDG